MFIKDFTNKLFGVRTKDIEPYTPTPTEETIIYASFQTIYSLVKEAISIDPFFQQAFYQKKRSEMSMFVKPIVATTLIVIALKNVKNKINKEKLLDLNKEQIDNMIWDEIKKILYIEH